MKIKFWSIFLVFFIVSSTQSLTNISKNKVIGSLEVESIEDFPYQTLQFSRYDTKTTLSSGAILTDYFVITCAHCIYNANNVSLFYGSKTISNLNYNYNQIILKENFIIHPNYSIFLNDIALMRLNINLSFNGEFEYSATK